MTPLPLLAHEAAAASAGTLRAIWRPVEFRSCNEDQDCHHPWLSWDGHRHHWQDGDELLDCPYGKPGDVVVGVWGQPDYYKVPQRKECSFRISAIDVRRVADMTEKEAVAWGCCGPKPRSFAATLIWMKRWPGNEWAWVMKLEAA